MVDDSTTSLPFPTPNPNMTPLSHPAPTVVLITGSTGSLGSVILHQLLTNDLLPPVTKIYALTTGKIPEADLELSIRPSGRIEVELSRQGLELTDEQWDRVEMVRWLSADQPESRLGMVEAKYNEIRREVTHIVHCAWLVDFNRTLPAFKPLVKATRGLVDMALSSPQPTTPRLLFTSSVGVHRKEEQFVKLENAPVGVGYNESKWVAETVLHRAGRGWESAAEDGRNGTDEWRPIVVRVGQLCGAANGYWKEHEWFPILIRSAITFDQFPQAEGHVDWLLTADAAKAICETLYTQEIPRAPLHLVHPNPVTWNAIIGHVIQNRYPGASLGSLLRDKVKPWLEWVNRVKEGGYDVDVNPAVRLLGWFSENMCASAIKLDTAKARGAAPSLDTVAQRQLGRGDVDKWFVVWDELSSRRG